MEKPNNVYCNLSFYCKKQNINDSDVQASFESNRNTPILENASDYEMSIAKLDIESQNIPILIPSIDTTQNNINLTNYQIQVIHNNVSIADAVNLQYSSRNKYKFSVPTVAGADSPYYYIYDIQQVVDMFNSACVEAVSGLSVSAPFMTYNNNNTFSIYFDELFETDYTFCVNDYLYNLFRNFSYNYIQNNQINYSILVTNKNYIS